MSKTALALKVCVLLIVCPSVSVTMLIPVEDVTLGWKGVIRANHVQVHPQLDMFALK